MLAEKPVEKQSVVFIPISLTILFCFNMILSLYGRNVKKCENHLLFLNTKCVNLTLYLKKLI